MFCNLNVGTYCLKLDHMLHYLIQMILTPSIILNTKSIEALTKQNIITNI